jgi:PAS domain S-box-containing protein
MTIKRPRVQQTKRSLAAKRPRARTKSAIMVVANKLPEPTDHWLDRMATLESALDRYATVFEQAPVGLVNLNASGVVIELNAEASLLLGGHRAACLGKPFICFIDRSDMKLVFKHFLQCAKALATCEVRLKNADGSRRPVQLHTRVAWSTEENAYSYHMVILDMSINRGREVALRASEKRHREIVETANEGICIVDADNQIVFANRRLGIMVGTTPHDLIGRSAFELCAEEDLAEARATFEQRGTGVAGQAEQRLRRSDGSTVWTTISTTVMTGDDGEFTGMIRMYTDASERHELAHAREALVRQLVAAQERERARIARELHDQMGQHIVALSLGLARLSSEVGEHARACAVVDELRKVADLLGRDVHTLAMELRPSALDHLGLPVALTSYAEEVASRSDLQIDVHCDPIDDLQLSGATQTGLYRIAQEALTNVVKHARAKEVSVILETRGSVLQLIIEDDGQGYSSVQMTVPTGKSEKLGITGMRERAALLGGTVTIESSAGSGTTVYARIPIPRREGVNYEQETSAVARR